MKCRRSEELWSDYLDGTLPRPLTKDLEGHLAECPNCPEFLEAFKEIRTALETMPHPHASSQLVERILAASRPRLANLANLSNFAERARFAAPLVPNLSWGRLGCLGNGCRSRGGLDPRSKPSPFPTQPDRPSDLQRWARRLPRYRRSHR